mgnify:CR=1 FL=1
MLLNCLNISSISVILSSKFIEYNDLNEYEIKDLDNKKNKLSILLENVRSIYPNEEENKKNTILQHFFYMLRKFPFQHMMALMKMLRL